MDDYKIEFNDVHRLWDSGRGISLDNPVVTSILTDMIMKNTEQNTFDFVKQLY